MHNAIRRAISEERGGGSAAAERLGLLTLREMVDALVHVVVGTPPAGVRTVGVPDIRRLASEGLS